MIYTLALWLVILAPGMDPRLSLLTDRFVGSDAYERCRARLTSATTDAQQAGHLLVSGVCEPVRTQGSGDA